MSHYQYLTQNSFLKLLAGVFFAAFILTACGGSSGGSATPAAADNSGNTDASNPLLDDTEYTNTEEKCGVQAIGTNAEQFAAIETDEYHRSGGGGKSPY